MLWTLPTVRHAWSPNPDSSLRYDKQTSLTSATRSTTPASTMPTGFHSDSDLSLSRPALGKEGREERRRRESERERRVHAMVGSRGRGSDGDSEGQRESKGAKETRDRDRDRQTVRETERQTHRETDEQIDRRGNTERKQQKTRVECEGYG